MTKACRKCGGPTGRPPSFHTCTACQMERRSKKSTVAAASHMANAAVRLGILPNPKTMKCADCDKPAQIYDHRDYNLPLVVAPVCRGCNFSRGAGVEYRIGEPAVLTVKVNP